MNEPFPPNKSRYASLDCLRGVFLLIMATNHLYWTWLHLLTVQPLGYVSAAEGFVFLSGLVVGLVSCKRWANAGGRSASMALWQRSFKVYGVHILSCLAIILWGMHVVSTGQTLSSRLPLEWFTETKVALPFTFLLLYQPGLLDVLPTYVMLLVITPPLLVAIQNGYGTWIAISSVILWIATNAFTEPLPTIAYQGALNTGAFNMTAWQLLYVFGLLCGHSWYHGTLPRWEVTWWKIAFLASIVALLSMASHMVFDLGQGEHDWLRLYTKNNLGPLRIYNFTMIALLIHALLKKFAFRQWFFELLGRHSLEVFATHCVVAMVIYSYPDTFEHPRLGPSIALLTMFSSMGLMAWWCESRKKSALIAASAKSE